jgi:hypothetical protein
MKKIYKREIRHIVANYSIRNNATAYRLNSKSAVIGIIRDMIRLNWIEGNYISGQFLYVSPSKVLKTKLSSYKPINNTETTPAVEGNLIWSKSTPDTRFKTPLIEAPVAINY